MVSESDEPTTEALRLQQSDKEHDERERAQQATTGDEGRAAERRADKAGYLKRKLDEQAASDDDS